MKFSTVRAEPTHLDQLVPLFDAYRVFYGQASNSEAAQVFLGERMSRRDSTVWLAFDEHRSGVGFVQLFPSFSSVSMRPVWILNDLFVRSEYRRCGIGRNLLTVVHEFAEATGAVRVDLATAPDNTAAATLYQQMGYQLDAAFDHYKFFMSAGT